LEDFQDIPTIFSDDIFTQAFEKAELARFGQTELDSYEYSLKVFRDNKAVYDYAVDTAFDEGKLEGKLEGILLVAKKLKDKGMDLLLIIEATGLSREEIDKL
jgi:predicted transposase/invertase (TIGR01784 family)